ncbi:MAG: toll/interleukin-1 receptor domain-containing protein, partial [Methanosarcinales archaeon]|nr:toll/interleukin-1 receptor domain-containing protein [Methanosarcinales archaeon]
MTLPTVFISYSHKDEAYKDLLHPQLGVLEKQDRITIWDDRQIDPGGKWFNEIKQVMDRAAVTVCLISADYLSSDFCTKEEIPYLLERREKDGMVLIPVLLRPCLWKAVPWLKDIQMLPRDGKSVSRDFRDEPDEVFAEVAENIFEIIDNPGYKPPEPIPHWSPPKKIDIRRLPMTGEELFGRQKQLEMLDQAWESDHTHIVSFVAWGGVGKSTLVNKWLERMGADNYRGASRVFAWSFYSQGTGEKVTSADLFIAEALDWFGDP